MEQKSQFEIKDMTGTIWMDLQKKVGSDREGNPTEYEVYTGSAKVLGGEFSINAYPKTTKNGKNILSLSFRVKQAKTDEAPF